MNTQYVSTNLVVHTCVTCGVLYGIQEGFDAQFKREGTDFHCPSGHLQHYSGETDKAKAERLEKKLHEERAARWAAEHKEQLAKNRLKRVKDRVANGVCPCCNRTFGNLHRHMKTRHPDFKKATEPKGAKP